MKHIKTFDQLYEAKYQKYRMGNQIPEDTNWTEFMKLWDIGVLDMDNIADKLGYEDFEDLELSSTPRRIIIESPLRPELADAIHDYTLKGQKMSMEDIEDELDKFGEDVPGEDEPWTDPAGGTHYPGEEDPARQYEDITDGSPYDLLDTSQEVEDAEEEELEEVSKEAQEYISNKISKLNDEGYENPQAVAMAYSYAKKAGYRVPKAPKKK